MPAAVLSTVSCFDGRTTRYYTTIRWFFSLAVVQMYTDCYPFLSTHLSAMVLLVLHGYLGDYCLNCQIVLFG